mmetsp:Transcript_17823/g.37371  ORF Transcript_17823/g.37371 Transcript_17823/m.37371 type:complete len:164 (+) Transcript_17823:81-572(+)
MSSAGGQRPPANRMTLQTFKARLGGASKGFKLLKKKRDALKAKFQALLKEIVDTKLAVGQSLKDGAFALAKAHYASSGDDIASTVIERAKKANLDDKAVPRQRGRRLDPRVQDELRFLAGQLRSDHGGWIWRRSPECHARNLCESHGVHREARVIADGLPHPG